MHLAALPKESLHHSALRPLVGLKRIHKQIKALSFAPALRYLGANGQEHLALNLPKAHFRSPRMRLQALTIGQLGGYLAQHLGSCFADFNDAGALLKIVNAKR